MGKFSMEPIEKDWLNKMLGDRNRTIDGRPLYTYRITSAEYKSLQDILSSRCEESVSLDELLEERGFSILFVFFATEWYKREYVGGFWRWDDIFAKFTTKTVKNPNRRSEAVRSALCSLKREIPKDVSGKKYFGAIITNGGLPAKYIQNNTSPLGIRGLITAALKYKLKYVVNAEDLMEYVEERAASYNFPDSLQNESMYQLVVDVVEKVVELKQRYNLNSKSSVITKLDAANPDWREEFPILLEDDAIRILLNTLMQDATEIKVAQKRPFVKRFLNGNSDELFLDTEIVFPTKSVEKDYFVRYFAISEDLPQTFYLNTWDDKKTKVAKIESDLFKPDVYTIASYGDKLSAIDSIVLETYSPINEKNINGFKVRLSESIDLSEPLVFIKDEKGKYVYVGSGDVGVATFICWIGCHANSILSHELELINTFKIDDQEFNLYKCDKDNVSVNGCEIRLNDTTKPKQYVLGGRLLQYKTKPYDAYMGIPQLYYIDEEQNYIKEQNVVVRRHRSDESLYLTECHGLVDICCVKNGRTVCKLPAFIFPVETTFKYKNMSINSGEIQVCNCIAADIIPISNSNYSAEVLGETVSVKALTEIPPSNMGIGIGFANNMGRVDIELPFPAKGYGFYNEEKCSINNDVVSLNDLYGKRVNIFGLSETCCLGMVSELQRIDKDLPTKDLFAEYRLSDYENDIRFLFGNTDEDIVLSLADSFNRPAKLYVSKYDMVAEIRDACIFVVVKTAVELDGVNVLAVDMLKKDAEPIQLKISSNGIIDTTALDASVYIVYTPASSHFSLKPIVYRKIPNPEISNFYRYIICGNSQALSQVLIETLISDYDSKIWHDVERLSQLFVTNEIPLDAINLWSCIANTPQLLAMYLVRGMFVKPYLDKEQPLQDAIKLAETLIDAQYSYNVKMLYKMRNELLIHTALMPFEILQQIISEYKVFFNRVLDDMFIKHINSNYEQNLWDYMIKKFKEPYDALKNKIWDKQYIIVATVFKEVSFILCRLMFEPEDFMRIVSENGDNYKILRNNMLDWANDKTTIVDWSDRLFGEINQMLNAYISPVTDGYIGIQIPHDVCDTFARKCKCSDTCKAPLFNFDRYLETRSFVIHFPMFCAWLANSGHDEYLQNPELLQTVKNFIRFHVNYFLEAYRISTIILSKV